MKNLNQHSVKRIVRFGDIDSAGVIHFHNLFRWCHEAWEENMVLYGLNALDIFPSPTPVESSDSIVLPIVHCEANFLAPIVLGDELDVQILPSKLNSSSFQVRYKFQRGTQIVSDALIKHRSINTLDRKPCDLPAIVLRWIEEQAFDM